jgi:hypothetical protein
MPSAREVLELADECIGLAERASSRRDREAFWRMAKAWLLIAEQAVQYEELPEDQRVGRKRAN